MPIIVTVPTETNEVVEIAIGELSKQTDVHIETIRYYERIKILPKPPRTNGGRRIYNATHVRILIFIKRSRDLGFSIDDVRELLRLGGPDKAPCNMVRDIGLGHLDDVRAKIAHLRQVERLLEKTISQCTGTTASECPVLDALDITRSEHPLNS
jgi:MerR family mercuric resistance operon transcriptional regulator